MWASAATVTVAAWPASGLRESITDNRIVFICFLLVDYWNALVASYGSRGARGARGRARAVRGIYAGGRVSGCPGWTDGRSGRDATGGEARGALLQPPETSGVTDIAGEFAVGSVG